MRGLALAICLICAPGAAAQPAHDTWAGWSAVTEDRTFRREPGNPYGPHTLRYARITGPAGFAGEFPVGSYGDDVCDGGHVGRLDLGPGPGRAVVLTYHGFHGSDCQWDTDAEVRDVRTGRRIRYRRRAARYSDAWNPSVWGRWVVQAEYGTQAGGYGLARPRLVARDLLGRRGPVRLPLPRSPRCLGRSCSIDVADIEIRHRRVAFAWTVERWDDARADPARVYVTSLGRRRLERVARFADATSAGST